jgi:hypothetical protein
LIEDWIRIKDELEGGIAEESREVSIELLLLKMFVNGRNLNGDLIVSRNSLAV